LWESLHALAAEPGNTGREEITLDKLKANAEGLVGAVLPDTPSNMRMESGKETTTRLLAESLLEPNAAKANEPRENTVETSSPHITAALPASLPLRRRKKVLDNRSWVDRPLASPKVDDEVIVLDAGAEFPRGWTRKTKPYLKSIRAKMEARRVPAKQEPPKERVRTTAEIEDDLYYRPGRPPEGVDANWVQCMLHCMAKIRKLPVGEDWFLRKEVERWYDDFGPDAILQAFRDFASDPRLSRGDHPLKDFRMFICKFCTEADFIESYFYSVGELKEARRKELGIGKSNEKPQS